MNIRSSCMFLIVLITACVNAKETCPQDKVEPLAAIQATQAGLVIAEKAGLLGMVELITLPIKMPVDYLLHNIGQ